MGEGGGGGGIGVKERGEGVPKIRRSSLVINSPRKRSLTQMYFQKTNAVWSTSCHTYSRLQDRRRALLGRLTRPR